MTETLKGNPIVVERVYPDDKRIRQETLAHHVARYEFATQVQTPKGQALDMCCGAGYGTDILRMAGYNARGFDISPEAIAYAKAHYPLSAFEVADANTANYGTDNSLVTFYEAIEHLMPDEAVVAIQKARASIQSGIFVVSTPRDLNENFNTYHRSKWESDRLKDVLGAVFSTVDMFGQDWDTAKISKIDMHGNDFYIAVCTAS